MERSLSSFRRQISRATVGRLPAYHRALQALHDEKRETVASDELADSLGVNPATLRRDLSKLGLLGVRGTGYDVVTLLVGIERALALDREWPVAIVGVGNLGRALARSQGFTSGEFRIGGLFDVDPEVVGTRLDGTTVCHLDGLEAAVDRDGLAIGVIATPASAAQGVATRLSNAGIMAILNFAPAVITVTDEVVIRHVDLAGELEVLAFYRARVANPKRSPRISPTIARARTQGRD